MNLQVKIRKAFKKKPPKELSLSLKSTLLLLLFLLTEKIAKSPIFIWMKCVFRSFFGNEGILSCKLL